MQEQGLTPVVEILVASPAFWILCLVTATRWVLGPAIAKMVESALEKRLNAIEEKVDKIEGHDFRIAATERLCEDMKTVPGDVRAITAALEILLERRTAPREPGQTIFDRRSE